MSGDRTASTKLIAIYLAVAFGFSNAIHLLMALAFGHSDGNVLVLGLMWGPALAAYVTCKVGKRPLSSLGFRWGERRYLWLSIATPALYGVAAYVVLWVLGKGLLYDPKHVEHLRELFNAKTWSTNAVVWTWLATTIPFGTLAGFWYALGEEIGWRGFLTPELYRRYGYVSASLVGGVIWTLWHVPGMLLGVDDVPLTPRTIVCFTVLIVAMTFSMTWLRMRSGSLWTGALFHGVHNHVVQGILTPMTERTPESDTYIDEYGILVPLAATVAAIYFYRRRHELPPPGAPEPKPARRKRKTKPEASPAP